MQRTALIVGVTGIAGRNLAEHLLEAGGWTVHGLARHPETAPAGVRPVAADLRDAADVRRALATVEPTHVFFTTWSRQATEAENCASTARCCATSWTRCARARPAARGAGDRPQALPRPVRGLRRTKPETPFREEQPRLPYRELLLRPGGHAVRGRRAATASPGRCTGRTR